MDQREDYFKILRKIQKEPKNSQRVIAKDLGISLGKLNYCLKELKNFQQQPNKIKYLRYVITPKGISERSKLTVNFMKRKMDEYNELKKELEKN